MDSDTLAEREAHPAAFMAKEWLATLSPGELAIYAEAFALTAINGNRLGEICSGTIQRLLNSEPVSDRYLLGLAWAIRVMEERSDKPEND